MNKSIPLSSRGTSISTNSTSPKSQKIPQQKSKIDHRLIGILAGVLLIKLIFLLLDRTPSYFMGDSESYLAVAVVKWIPGGRSFLYGLLIRRVALHLHSLEALIYLQAFCTAMAAWVLFFILVRVFGTRFSIAAVIGLLCAVEPLQLLMERYVMTESVSNFLFTIHILFCFLYLRRGRLWTLLLAQAVGVLLIGIRISFLPEVLCNSVLVPLLSPYAMPLYRFIHTAAVKRGSRPTCPPEARTLFTAAAHLILCLLVSQGLMGAYKHWYGSLMHREPALLYENGAFLMADFAPLIELQDFPKWAHGRAVLARVRINLRDVQARPGQHFMNGGLWSAVETEFPDPKIANQVGVSTATHALRREPIGALRLGAETFFSYFDWKRMREWLLVDEGAVGNLSPNAEGWLRDRFHVRAPKTYELTLTKRWHQSAIPWYWFILCVLTSSPLFLFLRRSVDLRMLIVLVTTALIFLEGATLTVDRPTPRFLTTDAWLVLLFLGVGAEALTGHFTYRRDYAPALKKA